MSTGQPFARMSGKCASTGGALGLFRTFLKGLAAVVLTAGVAGAATITNLTNASTESMAINGTVMEFRYTTGPASGGKALASQQYLLNGVGSGSTTAAYQSSDYFLSFGSTLPTGATVTGATLNLTTAVLQAMAVNSATFESSPKSFTINTGGGGCAGGAIGPASSGFGGNCRIDPFSNTVAGLPAKLKSIAIGSTTYIYGGGGVDIPTLGQVNLGGLNPSFLVELSNGGTITLTWTQLVNVTGSLGKNLGDNMLCKDCTVYYATTSSAAQNTRFTVVFNAEYDPMSTPEPATWAGMAFGLLLIAFKRTRSRFNTKSSAD